MTPAAIAVAFGATSAAQARDEARDILSERRFHGSDVPSPLHDVLSAIGRGVKALLDPVGELIDRLGGHLPGGPRALWIALATIVLAIAALLTRRVIRRRTAAAARRAEVRAGARVGDDPRALEREAAEAERAGERERAVRLRFRAGLVRLGHADLLELRPSLTTAEAARSLRSPTFDSLAATFERVAYGGRGASSADVDAARRGWPAVIDEARAA